MPSPLLIIAKITRGVFARRPFSLPALACALPLITALAACGSSGHGNKSAGVPSGSQSTTSTAAKGPVRS